MDPESMTAAQTIESQHVATVGVCTRGPGDGGKSYLSGAAINLCNQPCSDSAPTKLKTVGVIVDFVRRSVYHLQDRIYRLDLCLIYLMSCTGTTGHALRIIVGHIVNILLLCRPGLSLLDACYRFATDFGEKPAIAGPSWPAGTCVGSDESILGQGTEMTAHRLY